MLILTYSLSKVDYLLQLYHFISSSLIHLSFIYRTMHHFSWADVDYSYYHQCSMRTDDKWFVPVCLQASLLLISLEKEDEQKNWTVEGSAAVKKLVDNNKLQLNKQKSPPATKFCFIAKWCFNCHINQSFFTAVTKRKIKWIFVCSRNKKKRLFFYRLVTPNGSSSRCQSSTWKLAQCISKDRRLRQQNCQTTTQSFDQIFKQNFHRDRVVPDALRMYLYTYWTYNIRQYGTYRQYLLICMSSRLGTTSIFLIDILQISFYCTAPVHCM